MTDLNKEKLLILGDSHAHVFQAGKFNKAFPHYEWNLCYVMGATLAGLENQNSKTQALSLYKERLAQTSPTKVITLIGEVDIGYHLWYRNKKFDEPIDTAVSNTLESYKRFWNIISRSTNDILCISIPLPTIPDVNSVGEVASARSYIDAKQSTRTRVTLEFNKQLKLLCEQNKIKFLDLDPYSVGENGLVHSDLMHPNRFDHHYYGVTYSNLLIRELSKFI